MKATNFSDFDFYCGQKMGKSEKSIGARVKWRTGKKQFWLLLGNNFVLGALDDAGSIAMPTIPTQSPTDPCTLTYLPLQLAFLSGYLHTQPSRIRGQEVRGRGKEQLNKHVDQTTMSQEG